MSGIRTAKSKPIQTAVCIAVVGFLAAGIELWLTNGAIAKDLAKWTVVATAFAVCVLLLRGIRVRRK